MVGLLRARFRSHPRRLHRRRRRPPCLSVRLFILDRASGRDRAHAPYSRSRIASLEDFVPDSDRFSCVRASVPAGRIPVHVYVCVMCARVCVCVCVVKEERKKARVLLLEGLRCTYANEGEGCCGRKRESAVISGRGRGDVCDSNDGQVTPPLNLYLRVKQ